MKKNYLFIYFLWESPHLGAAYVMKGNFFFRLPTMFFFEKCTPLAFPREIFIRCYGGFFNKDFWGENEVREKQNKIEFWLLGEKIWQSEEVKRIILCQKITLKYWGGGQQMLKCIHPLFLESIYRYTAFEKSYRHEIYFDGRYLRNHLRW